MFQRVSRWGWKADEIKVVQTGSFYKYADPSLKQSSNPLPSPSCWSVMVFLIVFPMFSLFVCLINFLCQNEYTLWRQEFFFFLLTSPLDAQYLGKCLVLWKHLVNTFWMNEWIWRSYSGFPKLREWEKRKSQNLYLRHIWDHIWAN